MNKIKKNIPNAITISRIISSLIAPIIFINGNIIPSIYLYIYGAVSDCLDGIAARKLKAHTELGRLLDPISDKIYALSLMLPSIALGNILMLIPLILEGEITATIFAAKKSQVKIETERVGKYKTWFLFISIILGLLSTQTLSMYIPFVISLIPTIDMQIKSLKAYEKQYHKKLINKLQNNGEKIISYSEKNNNKEKINIKQKIKSHYDELLFYQNIPINMNTEKNVKKFQRIKRKP